jgi:NhaP-type Na+/H+ or K+/H+ antiporter
MALLLVFAVVLLLAVLLSALAHRTVLSTAVLFLVAGFLVGDGMLGLVSIEATTPVVASLAELALFAVLFTDGMRVGWADLRSAWRLPGRALGWGLPLTLLVTAVLAHVVVGLGWVEALLVGAILAPTDPVFAAALVGNDKVPGRLRQLLNVESGVNDGLALPFVVVLLALAADSDDLHLATIGWELLLGIAIGIVVPWVAIRLERTRWFAVSRQYAPLNAVAIGLLVLALGKTTHANLFLAAFAAGVTVATIGRKEREAFEQFGELVAEILKLAALLVFGALLGPAFFGGFGWQEWVFAVLALVLARPVALWVSFLGRPPDPARAAGRDVVRAQRIRIRGVRAAGDRRRDSGRRRGVRTCRADHRGQHRRPFLDRHRRRPRLRRRGHAELAAALEGPGQANSKTRPA